MRLAPRFCRVGDGLCCDVENPLEAAQELHLLGTNRHLSVAQLPGKAVRGRLSDGADTARVKFVAQLSFC